MTGVQEPQFLDPTRSSRRKLATVLIAWLIVGVAMIQYLELGFIPFILCGPSRSHEKS